MTQPRIAVVCALDSPLPARLAELAHRPVVQRYRDLYADADTIRHFDPAALFVSVPEVGPALGGALRMLQAVAPRLRVIRVAEPAQEVAARALVGESGAAVLVAPGTTQQLVELVEAALSSTGRRSAEALVEFARGISDEVNNPLLFLAGHLQLLARAVQHDPERIEQVRLVQDGVQRITAAMDRVRLLAQAGMGSPARVAVDLSVLARTVADRQDSRGTALLFSGAPPGTTMVLGDEDLLRAALEHLCQVGAALPEQERARRMAIEPAGATVRVRLLVDARRLMPWQLPRTFEPYYLSRILQGTPHGLSLFLIQLIAHRHGGRALARWAERGELGLELELPAARA